MRARPSLLFAALVVVTAAASVVATGLSARADPLVTLDGEAIDVSADRVDVDVEQGVAELRGAVTARVGDVELRCDLVELRYDRSPRVSWARGTGAVSVHVKGIEATAASVELDARTRTVTLAGSVRLSRGRGWMTAERAVLDLATNKVSLQGVKGSIPVEPRAH
jgi:lipopolysaccharide transport protein LptA